MREYHVVQVKKTGFLTGPLTAEKLASLLNKEAAKGWIFDKVLSGETAFLGSDIFFVVFYREA